MSGQDQGASGRPDQAISALRASVPSVEDIARDAFRAGWKERDRTPGLKRREKRSLDNAVRSLLGGGRYNDVEYVPDHRTYHHSIWLRSAFRKDLAQGIEARSDETAQQAQPEEQEPGPKDAPNPNHAQGSPDHDDE